MRYEVGRERHQYQKEEGALQFNSLLVDMVRSGEASWRLAREELQVDPRWEISNGLDLATKEEFFRSHVGRLRRRAEEAYHQLIDNQMDISLATLWEAALPLLQNDPRFEQFGRGLR